MATLRERRAAKTSERLNFDEWVEFLTHGGNVFPVSAVTTYGGMKAKSEPLEHSFSGYSRSVYKRNGIVFACMDIRAKVFSEITFRFAAVDNGKRGRLFGTPALAPLERPWPNGTTGDLAARMIQDADLAGNFYAVLRNGRIYRRPPDKTLIVLTGDPTQDEFVDIAGYVYQPLGPGGPSHTYLPHEVCHWSPIPDPEALYRGMSWLTPVLREVEADGAATDHKSSYFRNGATPNMAVTLPPEVMTKEQFEDFRRKMQETHAGPGNAYKTLYLAPGADVKPMGSDLRQLEFDATQGRDETRICSAAGVPAVIAGVKESMQGSSLNAGNYGQARRRLGDGTMRPLYRSAAGALSTIITAPQDHGPSELWYDDSQVAFFREDRADNADIQQKKAAAIRQLVDAGYKPDTVNAAIEADDFTLLEHSGLYSVQLQAPGAGQAAPTPTPAP